MASFVIFPGGAGPVRTFVGRTLYAEGAVLRTAKVARRGEKEAKCLKKRKIMSNENKRRVINCF